MPEGHTTHRLARLHRAALAGQRLRVTSPQGRFGDGAALLDGHLLDDVEAYGKHLFYAFDSGRVLHVHLGLVGSFTTHRRGPPAAGGGVRLRLAAGGVAVDLSGPMVCEVLDPAAVERVVGALGPDPLRRDADPERVRATLAQRRVAIATALLDQRVLAGIGNVFRAEGLFATGIAVDRPASSVARDGFDDLWRTLRRMLRHAERAGRIVTVEPGDVGAPSRARVPDDERVYVYRREGLPCRRCGTAVTSRVLGGRRIYGCPSCQQG